MKIFSFIFSALIATVAFSQNLLTSPNCNLEMHSVGLGESTPLQQEVEGILKVKGYNLIHPTEFNMASMPAYHMFASYRAGNASLTGNADCLIEEYKEFGTRYTCSYELNLVTMDIRGLPVLLNTVQYSARLAADSAEFYRNIREQLRVFPSCDLMNIPLPK